MNGKTRLFLSSLLLLAVLVGFPILLLWLGARAWEQHELNYTLSEAVGRQDIAKVEHLLEAGANPNAPWSGYSWSDQCDRIFHREPWASNDWTILEWETNIHRNGRIVRLLRQYTAIR